MRPWLRWIALTCLVLLSILVPFALWEDEVTAFSVRLLARPTGRALLSATVVVLLGSDILLPIPSSFVSAGAVALLGAGWGGASIAMGMTIGSWVGYGLGRWGGEPLARRMAGPAELERARRMMQRFGSWVLLVCRGVPVLAEASALLAGATRLDPMRFGLVTGLGNVGLALAYALITLLDLTGYAAWLAPFAFGIALPALLLLSLRARGDGAG
ncbi:MAG TPA: VTT domain-containing protein [Polyangiaceae bacterium]|nr:VTT domain-containing protein [Polyangiaceae bacterium]